MASRSSSGPLRAAATLPADEPSGIGAAVERVFFVDAATAASDFERRLDWQDPRRLGYAR